MDDDPTRMDDPDRSYSDRSDPERSDPVRDLEERRRQARFAVEQAGGGESEGFELAEEELIDHASHGDGHTPSRIMRDAAAETPADGQEYGEADEEHKAD